jgi:hypothetical protein
MKEWARPHLTTATLEENVKLNRDPDVLPGASCALSYCGIIVIVLLKRQEI